MADNTQTRPVAPADLNGGFENNFVLPDQVQMELGNLNGEYQAVGAVMDDVLSGPETPEGVVEDFSEENPAYDHPVEGFPDLIENIPQNFDCEPGQTTNVENNATLNDILPGNENDFADNTSIHRMENLEKPEIRIENEPLEAEKNGVEPTETSSQQEIASSNENVNITCFDNLTEVANDMEESEISVSLEGNALDATKSEQAANGSIESAAISKSDSTQINSEPENVVQWKKDRAKMIKEIDSRESIKKKEWSELAKNQLEIWDKNYADVVEKNKEANKSKNEVFMSLDSVEKDKIGYTSLEVTSPKMSNAKPDPSVWDYVAKLCDLNPNNRNIRSDVSRMRLLLLQLKKEGQKCSVPSLKA
ncbi:uncharacterized protein LOC120334828 [Styela clava]